MTRFALIAIITGIASIASAAPPDLAMVPPDAIAVVHVRGKDLWKSDLMSGLRSTVEKAGAKAIAAFDDGFLPRPSTLDRLTVVVMPPGNDGPPVVAIILSFDAPFDTAKIRATYCHPGESKAVPGKPIYRLTDGHAALHFAGDKQIVVAPEQMLERFLLHKPGKANPAIAAAIEKASSEKLTIVAAVDLSIVPPQMREIPNAPPGVDPLLAAKSISLELETAPGTTKFSFAARYADDAAAIDAEKAIKVLMGMATAELAKMKPELEGVLFGTAEKKIVSPRPLADFPAAGGAMLGLGFLNQMDEWVANPPFARKGEQLVVEATVPKEMTAVIGYYSMSLGLLLPAVQKVREAAGRMNGQNNLKQIGIALHNFHDVHNGFPAQAPDLSGNGPKDPKKRLSWRVHILPYIEQDNLYRQFKLDEPWDSDHNKKLIPLMPKTFADPRADAGEGKTFFKGVAGTQSIFIPVRGRTINSITDGTSNTIMVIAGGDAVTWTAPDDIEFDPKKELPDLTKPFGPRVNCLFADGAVHVIDFGKVKADVIKILLGVADGMIVPPNAFEGLDGSSGALTPVPVIPIPVPPRPRAAIPTKKGI
jgi:hypothetical protein